MVKWLECHDYDQRVLGLKPTCTILLCPCERHFITLFHAWQSQLAILNYSNIYIKLKTN